MARSVHIEISEKWLEGQTRLIEPPVAVNSILEKGMGLNISNLKLYFVQVSIIKLVQGHRGNTLCCI